MNTQAYFAERDGEGNLIAIYAREQQGLELDYLEPDDPELLAFLSGEATP